MKLNNLTPAKGSIKTSKRIGRGEGSGKGGTATKGHKGQKSRSGYSKKNGFEGGQMPIQRRVPKFGFKNPNRVEYKAINLDVLQTLADNKKAKKIDKAFLVANGILSKNDLFKVLSRGELSASLEVVADACSKKAKEIIESKGGSVSVPEKKK